MEPSPGLRSPPAAIALVDAFYSSPGRAPCPLRWAVPRGSQPDGLRAAPPASSRSAVLTRAPCLHPTRRWPGSVPRRSRAVPAAPEAPAPAGRAPLRGGPRAGQPVRRLRTAAAALDGEKLRCARREGFSLHANVALPAQAREQLEHPCCYLLRPPLMRGASTGTGGAGRDCSPWEEQPMIPRVACGQRDALTERPVNRMYVDKSRCLAYKGPLSHLGRPREGRSCALSLPSSSASWRYCSPSASPWLVS